MAEIRGFGFLRHLRSDASSFVLHHQRARLRRSGRGLSFWFQPLRASIAEVPVDDRDLPIVFHGRSADFQDVTAQGVLTYRIADPLLAAGRVDFTVDLASGAWRREPLEKLALFLSQLAQQHAWSYIARAPIREVLSEGPLRIRERIEAGLAEGAGLAAMGLEVVAVRIASVRPTADLEKALEAPRREQIQQEADQAAFARRALAVEKERAIQENELETQIELARRKEELIAQQGQNGRRQASEEAEAARIAAESKARQAEIKASAEAQGARVTAAAQAEGVRLRGQAEAETLRLTEEARVNGEKGRMEAYKDVPPAALLALSLRELAGKLRKIEHLNLSPDVIGPGLADLLQAAAGRLARE